MSTARLSKTYIINKKNKTKSESLKPPKVAKNNPGVTKCRYVITNCTSNLAVDKFDQQFVATN